MYYSDLSSGEIRHQIGFDNYIVVENDLSRYGLDFAICLKRLGYFDDFCELFNISYEQLADMLHFSGYSMRDIFSFVYSSDAISHGILVSSGAYYVIRYDKQLGYSRQYNLDVYLVMTSHFLYSSLLSYMFRVRYGFIYSNFLHNEKRFPQRISLRGDMKLSDVSYLVTGGFGLELTLKDVCDILTKGESVFDEEIPVSDFRFYDFSGGNDLFFLDLDDGLTLYIPYKYLVTFDWDLVCNVKRYEIDHTNGHKQSELPLFSHSKVLHFKNICENYKSRYVLG